MRRPESEQEQNQNDNEQSETFARRGQLIDVLASLLASVWLDRYGCGSAEPPSRNNENEFDAA